jgi:short-subunit dehydrogenase
MSIPNKVIWITGASSGIGEALVLALNELGAKLIISARNRDMLYQVKQNCKKNQLNIHVLTLDLEQTESLYDKAQDALRIYGWVDIIIHCGGISQRATALETPLEIAQKIMNTNYWGTVALTQAIVPSMIEKGSGHVVVISSLMGKFGTRLRSSYSASKHALHGYFDSMRNEVFDKNITITLVCPGFIKTNATLNALKADGNPQNKMDEAIQNAMDPADCANRIIKAIEQQKEEVFFGGKEKYGVLLKRFFPKAFSNYIRKAKVT